MYINTVFLCQLLCCASIQHAIGRAGGISALVNLLRMPIDEDILNLVTGILWNLSSCQVRANCTSLRSIENETLVCDVSSIMILIIQSVLIIEMLI